VLEENIIMLTWNGRVMLNATNITALEEVDLEDFKKYAADMLQDKPHLWQ
jgi:hypothetical protein